MWDRAYMDHPTLAGHHFPCHNSTEISLKISSVAPNIWHQPLSRSSDLRSSLVKEKRQIATIQDACNIKRNPGEEAGVTNIKVARYSFSRPMPPKFEHKLRRHKESFGKIAITVVLDKDENLLWSGWQRHRSCHSNEMTLLAILLAAVYLGTRNCSSEVIHGSFFLQ